MSTDDETLDQPEPVERATAQNRSKSMPGKLTPTVLRTICENYASGMTMKSACESAHVSMHAFMKYLRKNPEFEQNEWRSAEALNTGYLENRAHELAITADHRSPTMIIFLLKARRPEKYRDNHSVAVRADGDFAGAFAEAMARVVSGSPDRPSTEVH